jgi:integrase/recombinase XerD
MIDDMTVRNLAPNTMLCYLKQVHYLARYFRKSPAQLTPEDIREYQLYLAQDRKVSVSSRLVAMTALPFLYRVTLRRERFIEMLPMPRKEHHLPVILSPAEVLRFLEAAPSYSHRVIFSTMYGTGMRVSEALHLRMGHIDSQRMMIRIEQAKGTVFQEHSFATHMLDNGAELPVIQVLLGHDDPRDTMIYLHLSTQKLKSAPSPLEMFDLAGQSRQERAAS